MSEARTRAITSVGPPALKGTMARIGWSEGMFLKPQHFQHADLFQDARLASMAAGSA